MTDEALAQSYISSSTNSTLMFRAYSLYSRQTFDMSEGYFNWVIIGEDNVLLPTGSKPLIKTHNISNST